MSAGLITAGAMAGLITDHTCHHGISAGDTAHGAALIGTVVIGVRGVRRIRGIHVAAVIQWFTRAYIATRGTVRIRITTEVIQTTEASPAAEAVTRAAAFRWQATPESAGRRVKQPRLT